ncbi:MAG: hypothetical protein E7336_12100 [Clostridiales bacterium]|nr:hypothetical protein [Clostridiales bacterium]
MKKLSWLLALLVILAAPIQGGLADKTDAATPYSPAEYTAEYEKAAAALLAHTPDAVVDYAVRERDDGRYEWDLFFDLNGRLGVCEVIEPDFSVRRIQFYDMPEGALTASQIVEALMREKGEIRIIDLELDFDDGRLRYEGVAELTGKRYEFELGINGKIIEWERD